MNDDPSLSLLKKWRDQIHRQLKNFIAAEGAEIEGLKDRFRRFLPSRRIPPKIPFGAALSLRNIMGLGCMGIACCFLGGCGLVILFAIFSGKVPAPQNDSPPPAQISTNAGWSDEQMVNLTAAAMQGNGQAAEMLAVEYFDRSLESKTNWAQAVHWAKVAANLGNIQAMNSLENYASIAQNVPPWNQAPYSPQERLQIAKAMMEP